MRVVSLLMLAACLALAASRSTHKPRNIKEYYRKDNDDFETWGDLFEGDIRLPDEDDDSEESDEHSEESDESDEGGTGRRNKVFRWPKSGGSVIVPFEIDDDQQYTEQHKANMRMAMEWIEKDTCVKFEEHTDQEHYLFITMENDGCWSYVGKVGDIKEELKKQTLNFAHKCAARIGTMAHEMIHALGFFHMQSHPDRDEYVQVNFKNMEEKHRKNYKLLEKEKTLGFNTGYDYKSIMHYGPMFFSKNNKPTMEALKNPKEKNNKFMGQRNKLSPDDIIRINEMYGCKKGTKRKHEGDAADDDSDESDDSEDESDETESEENDSENEVSDNEGEDSENVESDESDE